jgi:hypothetical protein
LAKVAESLDGTVTLDPQALSDRLTVIGEDYVVQNPATWTAAARPPD